MRLADELSDLGTIEQHPSQEGRNMTMLLAPVRVSPNSRRSEKASDAAILRSVDSRVLHGAHRLTRSHPS